MKFSPIMQGLLRLLLSSFLLGLTMNVFAQTGEIFGTVVDKYNEPLPNASVVVTSQHGIFMDTVFADFDGHFIFSLLSAGNYIITASYQTKTDTGFITIESTRTIAHNGEERISTSFALEVDESEWLDEPIIRIDPPLIDKEIPGNRTTITDTSLERMCR